MKLGRAGGQVVLRISRGECLRGEDLSCTAISVALFFQAYSSLYWGTRAVWTLRKQVGVLGECTSLVRTRYWECFICMETVPSACWTCPYKET